MDNRNFHPPPTTDEGDGDRPSATTRTPQQSANLANAFARRFQAFFPSTQSTPASTILNNSAASSQRREFLPPKFLKVRIVTWNMHDSLPKGDLTELLGEVPVYNPEWPDNPPLTSIPPLTANGKHPYHLVVVSGMSDFIRCGIPMGLGAGFKLKDKEKESISPIDSEPDLASMPYGWTAILEDWLSHAGGSNPEPSPITGDGSRKVDGELLPPIHPNIKRRISTKAAVSQKGPYEILIKERMMGLYLAVYVHREIKHLVRGLSKSSVTTGLIGGRVGNKGGLGISVNLDGTTLLFVNAHLAAHEGKVQHRLNDLAKIKGELTVDDFLTSDDSRFMAEDLTDRFDYTFIFGDLNFRLDISRLHADWLISRRDFAQAFCFDQLRNLMEHGDAFVGFNEADISFPPTFKYDVVRTFKRLKPKSVRSPKQDSALVDNPLIEEPEVHVDVVDAEVENGDGYGDNDDVGSVASSNTISINYRSPSERVSAEDDYFSRTRVLRASTGNLVQKVKTMAAAQKAKTKWLARLSSAPSSLLPNNKSISSPMLSTGLYKWSDELRKSSLEEWRAPALSSKMPCVTPPMLDSSSTRSSAISKSIDRPLLGPPPFRTDPYRSTSDEEVDEDRGVYDSSSKKRVPSWCDRILWKSTIEPEPEPDDDGSEVPHPKTRTRVGQLIANFKIRYRKGSSSSCTSSELSNHDHAPPVPSRGEVSTPSDSAPDSPMPTNVGGKGPIVFSRFVAPDISAPEVVRSSFVDNVNQTLGIGFLHSFPAGRVQSEGKHREPSRTGTTLGRPSPLSASPPPMEPVPTTTTTKNDQVVRSGPTRWRFLPFFRGDSGQATATADPALTPVEPTELTTSSITYRPSKGDVECLGYGSLDDRAMRRLEGRSDHRPVVGSFAIYL